MTTHIEYWMARDGKIFETESECDQYEIRYVERENGIEYYDIDGKLTDDFDRALKVVVTKALPEDDNNMLKTYYYWTIPNEVGTYVWNGDVDDWRRKE